MDCNNTWNCSVNSNPALMNQTKMSNEGLDELRRYINLVFLPIIILIGLVGNSLTFYVLNKSPLRHQSCNVYLAFLSLVDAGFLCCLVVVWADYLMRDTSLSHTNGFCQVIPFLTYVFGFLSVYTVVCFTVERFIVTFYPLKRQTICTRTRAKTLLLFVSAFAIIFFSFPLYMSEVIVDTDGKHKCILRQQFMFAAHVLSCLDTALTMVFPALIILTLNAGIGVRLARIFSKERDVALGRRCIVSDVSSSGNRRTLLQTTNKAARESSTRSGLALVTRPATTVKTTRTLLLVSTTFVVLNLPSHALRVYMLIVSLIGHRPPQQVYVAQELAQFIYYVNFGSNIFLYSICSKAFRHSLRIHTIDKLWSRKAITEQLSLRECNGVTLKPTTMITLTTAS
jgi:hypothetical protein